MKRFNLPPVGLRNLKTALAVLICIQLFNLFGNNYPFYACIAAVICMKDTIDSTVTMGVDRLIGTFVGGLIGVIFLYITLLLPYLGYPNAFIIGLGVILIIYIFTVLKKPGSVTIGCIVFIGIMISYSGSDSYHYAISRIFDTAVGVIVALLVNKYLWPSSMNKED